MLNINKILTPFLLVSLIILTGCTSSSKPEEYIEVTIEDTTPPIVKTKDGTITEGDKLELSDYYSVTDNLDEKPKIDVNGEVDTHKAGTYKIKVFATDNSKNKSSGTFTITVKEKPKPTPTPTPTPTSVPKAPSKPVQGNNNNQNNGQTRRTPTQPRQSNPQPVQPQQPAQPAQEEDEDYVCFVAVNITGSGTVSARSSIDGNTVNSPAIQQFTIRARRGETVTVTASGGALITSAFNGSAAGTLNVTAPNQVTINF